MKPPAQDGRVLLVKEKEDGPWTLPGGRADIGDSPSVARIGGPICSQAQFPSRASTEFWHST
jgi:hypothetical protein